MDGPDVRWDGVPHRRIVEWVSGGPGAALTEQMEARLRSAAEALDYTSGLVHAAIQRAGGDWQGSTADAATAAMRVLRSFDDGMHFTSNVAGIRAFGQSDGAGFVRANVPPVVEVSPPNPTGGLIDVLDSTVDIQRQQAAAREAEQRAREVMQQYTEATRERVASMPPLTPAPQVVLEVSPTSPPEQPPPIGEPPRPRDPQDARRPEGGPVQGPDSETRPPRPDPTAPSVTPGPTQAAVAPGQGSVPITSGLPAGPVSPPDGPAVTAPAPTGGLGHQGRGERSGPRPLGERPERDGERPGRGGGGPQGAGPAARGAATARGTAGHGAASPVGVGPGTRREEDREHQVRYGVPTAEHFEPDDPVRDPHREGWSVLPEIIGAGDEEGDNR